MMMTPNIFYYAPAELSQDAFFCWLLAWADVGNATADPLCHRAGLAFLNALIGLHGEPPVESVTVEVRRQFQRADIVVAIGDRSVILIEDKVHAGIHGDQLTRILENINRVYPGHRIFPTYVKTGDQSSYKKVEEAGYRLFLRRQMIDVLRPFQGCISNAIFAEFISNVERIDCQVESYAAKPVTTWVEEWDPWVGFYKRLQRELDHDVQWDYVPNPSGGFLGAWWGCWNWTDPVGGRTHVVYLQIEQGPLCFKLAVAEDETDRAAVRNRWYERLMATSHKMGVVIDRPGRMGNGAFMTVGRIEWAKWLAQDPNGMLDFGAVATNLCQAASVVDRAAKVDV